MTVRPCLAWPDKRLRTPAEPVAEITDEVRAIWVDMIDTMEAMPGVGLAAPQIGVMLRLAVVDASTERGQMDRRELVGLWSTSLQHQIDHLNGKMYFDRLSKLKRDMLLRRAAKLK